MGLLFTEAHSQPRAASAWKALARPCTFSVLLKDAVGGLIVREKAACALCAPQARPPLASCAATVGSTGLRPSARGAPCARWRLSWRPAPRGRGPAPIHRCSPLRGYETCHFVCPCFYIFLIPGCPCVEVPFRHSPQGRGLEKEVGRRRRY